MPASLQGLSERGQRANGNQETRPCQGVQVQPASSLLAGRAVHFTRMASFMKAVCVNVVAGSHLPV